jgi:hypothetical protein
MCLCVRGIDFVSFYALLFDFGIMPTMWYVFTCFLFHEKSSAHSLEDLEQR